MHRLLLSVLLALVFAFPVFAQEQQDDETGYATENEDDFEASQDVAADQSVAFPTDI